MQKLFTIVLVTLLCISLAACGGKSNPEHDYILSLLEKGDYDMAILVIEGIRDRELGSTTAPAEETVATEQTSTPTEAPAPVLSGPSAMVYEAVARFMAEKDGDLMVALPLTISDALEYRLGNYDGKGSAAHCILVSIQSAVYYQNTAYDQLQLAMDLNTGKIYNSIQIDQSLLGRDCDNADMLCTNIVNSYFCRLQYGEAILWADAEIIEPLHQNELDTINRQLASN